MAAHARPSLTFPLAPQPEQLGSTHLLSAVHGTTTTRCHPMCYCASLFTVCLIPKDFSPVMTTTVLDF